MKGKLKTALVLLIIFAMAVSCAACGGAGNSSTTTGVTTGQSGQVSTAAVTEPAKEVVTLKLVEVTNTSGTDTNDDVSKELEKKLSVKIEYVDNDEEKFKVMLAGGDIGDIISVKKDYQKQLIDGGQIIAMDDLLQTNGKDILANASGKVAYAKKYMSEGQDKLYYLPAHGVPSTEDFLKMSQYEYQLGAYVRWDYYKELGYPEVNNPDEYLNVLAEMQKKHPTTADGKKTYSIALWSDWGNFHLLCADAYNYNGQQLKSDITYYDNQGNLNEPTTSDDSFLWKTLKFFFKAKQMGLFDPDSFTQKWENVKVKIENGQILTTNNSWSNTEINAALNEKFGADAGMGLIPTVYPAVFSNTYSPIGWAGSFSVAITNACKNPDRAMDFINYLHTYEGARLVYSGIKDLHWSVVDGKPEMKAEVLQQSSSDKDFIKKTGINRAALSHFVGLDNSAIDPVDGTIVDLFKLPKALELKNTAFTKAYSEHFGVTYPGAAVEKAASEGKIALGLYNSLTADLMPQLTDDLKRMNVQIDDYIIKLAPKVVLAKTEAEADAAIQKAKDELKKMGSDKLAEWEAAEYQKAMTAAAEFAK